MSNSLLPSFQPQDSPNFFDIRHWLISITLINTAKTHHCGASQASLPTLARRVSRSEGKSDPRSYMDFCTGCLRLKYN